MRMDWKSVGPVCRRVADDLRAEQGRSSGLTGRVPSAWTRPATATKYMTVVVDHDRGAPPDASGSMDRRCSTSLSELLVYGTYLRLLLFSWVRSWVVVVGCRVHRIGA